MPNFNYTIDVMSKDGQHKLMSILMIDTIKLCGNTDFTLNPFKSVDDKTPSFSSVREQMMAKLNLIDLENKLKTISSSNVTYILVGGHFPVYSIASHGSTQCLIDNIMPLLHKYRVSAYLSGHDHNLQHISHTFLNATVEYMVTGANSVNSFYFDLRAFYFKIF
jgi:tartrate-resistant acid phosphatase type 5